MGVKKFILREEHLKILKHINWSLGDNKEICSIGNGSPLGGFNHYEDIAVIIYGNTGNIDLLNDSEFRFTQEQLIEMDTLLEGLPIAIEIILNTQSFEPGEFITRHHLTEWKKK
jgi:hypothetical protein